MSDFPSKPATAPRRRFAPVPIETTFERYRRAPPAGEPTPSPSPRSLSPASPASPPEAKPVAKPIREEADEKRDKRKENKKKFAPQLIETSRRSRRNGDVGPATKPTDKTDITPYQNHIYAIKPKKKMQSQHHHHHYHHRIQSQARRESCDEETATFFLDLHARETEKRLLEAALAAFPNSQARAGGAEHFAIRESSDDDSTGRGSGSGSGSGSDSVNGSVTGTQSHAFPAAIRNSPRQPPVRNMRRTRRDSLTEDVGWAVREMQEHHDQLAKARASSVTAGAARTTRDDAGGDGGNDSGKANEFIPQISPVVERISTPDLDRMSMDSPPTDPIWTTNARRPTTSGSEVGYSTAEPFMPLISEEAISFPGISDGYRGIPAYARKLREAEGDLEEEDEEEMLWQAMALSQNGADKAPADNAAGDKVETPAVGHAPPASAAAAHLPAETSFRGRGPFAGYRNRDLFAEREAKTPRRVSPPLLGKDLVFPKCQSPQQTKLAPEYLWSMSSHMDYNESHRDATGKHGLWHGYCYSREKNEAVVPIERPVMLATPYPPTSPHDPFDRAFAASLPGSAMYTSEPAQMMDSTETPPGPASAPDAGHGLSQKHEHHHPHHDDAHMLAGLGELLEKEKEEAELEEKIAAEFNDSFVTQVFNYLSLGYPSMARSYDDELSKISHISVPDLERDDHHAPDGGTSNIPGYVSLDIEGGGEGGSSKEGEADAIDEAIRNNPRWIALKLYVHEWARQHPDLDSTSPLAWGMSERRGSWGV